MDKHLLQLRALLDALEVKLEGRGFGGRLLAQKAVHLGQRAGVDLGYRFSWYRDGPYIPRLAQDCYELWGLPEEDQDPQGDTDRQALAASYRAKLGKATDLLAPPEGVQLPRSHWLELVASLDYLVRVCRYDPQTAEDTVSQNKPHVAKHVPAAWKALEDAGLGAARALA